MGFQYHVNRFGMPQCGTLCGCAEPTDHYGCSIGQFGHFGGSHAMITQHFENSQKSVFYRTLVLDFGMKGWFARVAQTGA